MCRSPQLPELLLGLKSWFRVGSRLPYLLLHAVLGHRVTALGRHLGSVFCQGEKVLEGSSGDLLSQRGQVAGEHRECGGSGGWDPPSQETAPSRGAGGGDGEHRACSAPVLCTEHLQGFTPELKLIFLNAACQQDLSPGREELPPSLTPVPGWKSHFPLYLKLTLSFPYTEKREQIRFDVRVSRERVFLSSFCHKKRMEMFSSSQSH